MNTCLIHIHIPDGPTMPSGLSAAPGSRSTSPCEVIGSSSPGGPSVLTPAGPCRPAPAFQQYRMFTSAMSAIQPKNVQAHAHATFTSLQSSLARLCGCPPAWLDHHVTNVVREHRYRPFTSTVCTVSASVSVCCCKQ